MDQALEERIQSYTESVQSASSLEEKPEWQHPLPVYHATQDYRAGYGESIDTSVPAVFKKQKKEWVVGIVIVVIAGILIYLLGKNEFGFIQLLLLTVLLLVVLPRLLENKPVIRVNADEIWLHKENKEIPWEHVVLTYIKEAHEESVIYSFVIHYYDEDYDHFRNTEIELKGITEPALLAASIEAFRNGGSKSHKIL